LKSKNADKPLFPKNSCHSHYHKIANPAIVGKSITTAKGGGLK
jgi:hypothetical protein